MTSKILVDQIEATTANGVIELGSSISFPDNTIQTTAAVAVAAVEGFALPTQASLSTGTIVQAVNTTYQSLYLGSGGAGWYYFQDFNKSCRLLNVSGWTNNTSDGDGINNNQGADIAGIFYCTNTPRLYSLKWGNNNNVYSGGSIKWVKIE